MIVEDASILIESRSEINLLQDMISKYIDHELISDSDKKGLESILNQLDGLYYSW